MLKLQERERVLFPGKTVKPQQKLTVHEAFFILKKVKLRLKVI